MNNLNTAKANSGIATAEDTEVVDFAERLDMYWSLK
jgi:hypothetical protein